MKQQFIVNKFAGMEFLIKLNAMMGIQFQEMVVATHVTFNKDGNAGINNLTEIVHVKYQIPV